MPVPQAWLVFTNHLSFAALMIQAGSSSYLLGHNQATTKAVEFRNPAPKVTCPLFLTEVSTKEGMPWLLWGVRFKGGEER